MKTLRGVVALFFFALSAAAAASAVSDLHNFVAQTHSATGQFTQRVVSSSKKVTQSTGQFVFVRPGKFRWTYATPYQQVLVADGQKFTMYDHDLNQVTVRKINEAIGATPAAILFGDGSLEHSFDVADAPTRDGLDWVDATPKSHDTTFQRVSIGFRSGQLAAMELHDAMGQVTLLTFTDVQRNGAVAPDTFQFVPPAGADVLQN